MGSCDAGGKAPLPCLLGILCPFLPGFSIATHNLSTDATLPSEKNPVILLRKDSRGNAYKMWARTLAK